MARVSLAPLIVDASFKWEGSAVNLKVRQARTGDSIQLGNLFSETTRVWNDEDFGQVQLKQKWNQRELQRYRAFLVLVGCDLEDEDGESLFKFREGKRGPELAMEQRQFNNIWDALPELLTEKINDAVIEANPQWGPNAGE